MCRYYVRCVYAGAGHVGRAGTASETKRCIYANARIKCCGIFAQVSAKVKVFVILRKEKLLIFCGKRLARASTLPSPRPATRRASARPPLSPMKVKPVGRAAPSFGSDTSLGTHCNNNNVRVSSHLGQNL